MLFIGLILLNGSNAVALSNFLLISFLKTTFNPNSMHDETCRSVYPNRTVISKYVLNISPKTPITGKLYNVCSDSFENWLISHKSLTSLTADIRQVEYSNLSYLSTAETYGEDVIIAVIHTT